MAPKQPRKVAARRSPKVSSPGKVKAKQSTHNASSHYASSDYASSHYASAHYAVQTALATDPILLQLIATGVQDLLSKQPNLDRSEAINIIVKTILKDDKVVSVMEDKLIHIRMQAKEEQKEEEQAKVSSQAVKNVKSDQDKVERGAGVTPVQQQSRAETKDQPKEVVKASPVKASPVKASPVKASPVKASPVKASFVEANPVKASPVKANPVKASPVKVNPVKASPNKPSSAKASPAKPSPAKNKRSPAKSPVRVEPTPLATETPTKPKTVFVGGGAAPPTPTPKQSTPTPKPSTPFIHPSPAYSQASTVRLSPPKDCGLLNPDSPNPNLPDLPPPDSPANLSVRFSALHSASSPPAAHPAALDSPPPPAPPVVHFSAMNPNPNLNFTGSNDDTTTMGPSSRVSFTPEDRSEPPSTGPSTGPSAQGSVVSWEDETRNSSKSVSQPHSRNSRSGLSSPAIEPSLSPLNTSKSKIAFDSTISTITQAAGRLTSFQLAQHDAYEGSTGVPSQGQQAQVTFSAQRTNIQNSAQVVDAQEGSVDGASSGTSAAAEQAAAAAEVVQFDLPQQTPLHPDSSESRAASTAVAARLKRLIRRAEGGGSTQSNGVPLEVAFQHFDEQQTGRITPTDLQEGLRKLGESFLFTMGECEGLIKEFSSGDNESGSLSLLGWYRALGRSSPPPSPYQLGLYAPAQRSSITLTESPVVRAEDAAIRLRSHVRDNIGNQPVESAFAMFDSDNTGKITAGDFHRGLQSLGGGNFAAMNDEDCEELVSLFDVNRDGHVSLLDFYRFMGKHSPPLKPSEAGDAEEELSDFELEVGNEMDTSAAEKAPELEVKRDREEDDEDDEYGDEFEKEEEEEEEESPKKKAKEEEAVVEEVEEDDYEEEFDSEDDYEEDEFDEFEGDDENKKAILFEPRRVSFPDVLVSETRERPRTAPSDVAELFYTEAEIAKFEDLAFLEEQRGMEAGDLDEETYEREQAERNREGEQWRRENSAGAVADPDALETFSDYSDESFDNGGFEASGSSKF